ncbi:IclR family transcriptional regulator [Candidatus Gracilibacteria bacterium]|nr:IclR family transcriptional regulator [Candidatus Gracilibacteria bacterium]
MLFHNVKDYCTCCTHIVGCAYYWRRNKPVTEKASGSAGPRESASSLTQTVERALSILTCFSDARPRIRVSDIARELELSQSTVSRLLATMEALGFVERDPTTGLYNLGLELVTLAGVALNQIEVRRQAMSELSAAATELGLAANLAILRGDEIFYLATVEGPKAPKQHTMIGKRNMLHCTGMGKVLLAHLPDSEREQCMARLSYPRLTPNTAGSAEDLLAMLDQVLAQGYAAEREELAFGRACVAAPIRDASGVVIAATSISGPTSAINLEQAETHFAGRVIQMADTISHNLGYITVPTALTINRRLSVNTRSSQG